CEPEVASVGLTEAQAREKHGDVQTLVYDLAGNGKSQILQTHGAIKLVKAGAEGTPGPVGGIHMVGARVGELIGEAQLVYNWDAQAEEVAAPVRARPPQDEAVGEAHLALAGTPPHSHGRAGPAEKNPAPAGRGAPTRNGLLRPGARPGGVGH